MAIIKCPNCSQDVSDKAMKCPHCDYTINKVETFKSNNENYIRKHHNPVAKKFSFLVILIKAFGYFGAFMTLIICSSIKEVGFGTGLVYFIIIFIVTWLSTLVFEAIEEGLNLLQEIRDK